MNISATYLCGACGNVASTVTLVAPGEPDPRMTPEADVPPGLDTLFGSVLPDSAMLSIDGGPASLSLGAASTAKMILALESGDPAALYAINREFAPFWCPSCGLSYCTEHYRSYPVFDEGFFDYIQGICPKGHERNVMD